MPIQIANIEAFHNYLSGVRQRADHHAENVNSVILALAGAVVLFKDDNTSIECREYKGEPANVLFVTIRGRRYVLTYNHELQTVEIRRDTLQGESIQTFDNNTTIQEIIRIFNTIS